MKKNVLFIALLLSGVGLLPRQAHARTNESSPEMYTPVSGDTLSRVVTDKCGKTSLWPSVAAANHLVSPYRIYVGRAIRISCEKNSVATIAAIVPLIETEMDSAMIAIPTEPIIVATISLPAFISAPPKTVAEATNPFPTIRLSNEKAQRMGKITCYKLPIPKAVAVASGIPLGLPLVTHYSLYRPFKFVKLKGKSWAREEGENIVLYVPIKELPKQKWSLTIRGIETPIDGELFTANAQAFQGKIPGPHTAVRTLFSVAMLGGGGYTLAAAFGPYVGSGVAIGMLGTRLLMRHRANALLDSAEKNYSATLARQDNEIQIATEKEPGQ